MLLPHPTPLTSINILGCISIAQDHPYDGHGLGGKKKLLWCDYSEWGREVRDKENRFSCKTWFQPEKSIHYVIPKSILKKSGAYMICVEEENTLGYMWENWVRICIHMVDWEGSYYRTWYVNMIWKLLMVEITLTLDMVIQMIYIIWHQDNMANHFATLRTNRSLSSHLLVQKIFVHLCTNGQNTFVLAIVLNAQLRSFLYTLSKLARKSPSFDRSHAFFDIFWSHVVYIVPTRVLLGCTFLSYHLTYTLHLLLFWYHFFESYIVSLTL